MSNLGVISMLEIEKHSWRRKSFVAELLTGNTLKLVEGMQYWQLISWCSPCCGLLLQKGKFEEEEE